jgi:hypothetical protein
MSEAPNEPVTVEYLARVTEMDPILTSLSSFLNLFYWLTFDHFSLQVGS